MVCVSVKISSSEFHANSTKPRLFPKVNGYRFLRLDTSLGLVFALHPIIAGWGWSPITDHRSAIFNL